MMAEKAKLKIAKEIVGNGRSKTQNNLSMLSLRATSRRRWQSPINISELLAQIK
jgi:hypothetical protein